MTDHKGTLLEVREALDDLLDEYSHYSTEELIEENNKGNEMVTPFIAGREALSELDAFIADVPDIKYLHTQIDVITSEGECGLGMIDVYKSALLISDATTEVK